MSFRVSFLTLLICSAPLFSSVQVQSIDTAKINRQTKEAYIIARRNPDLSILNSHQALSESVKASYKKGMADASLALGMAYLARYNPGDSAHFYNNKALELYRGLENYQGEARACYALAYVYSFKGNMNESERFSNLSLEYFKKAGDQRGVVNAYNSLTYIARQRKDFDRARELVTEAIAVARSINDTLPLADALNSLGNIYSDMALFNEAIESYFEALKLWEMKKDSAGLAIAYGSIGLMYYYQKDYKRALEFNFRKIPLTEKAGDIWELSKTYNNISQVYNSKNEYDSALIYLRKGLALNLKVNYKPSIATAYNNMATALLLKSETDSADLFVRKAVAIAREINDPELANYLTTLGHVYKAKGEYTQAIENTLSGHRLATEKKDPVGIYQSSALLSDLYRLTGHKDMAYDYLKEYMTLKDSINNDRFLKRIARLEIQNEYDRKQKAAELEQIRERLRHETRIKQQRIYLNGLLILLGLLAVISILYIRQSRFRLKYTRMDLEQRLLRAQMNPHFIFNSLCAIQDLILSGKYSRANTFLTKIAKLMRNILENSSQEFIPLEKEIETLKLYLDIQQLRFEKEFKYSFEVDKAIDPENISVPPMLAQPCIENSIEHGLLPGEKRGNINIKYILDNGLLTLEVTDDGIGRDRSALTHDGHAGKKSISTSLTQKRLEHFRFALKERKISYRIIDLFNEQQPAGTRVIMKLPYKKVFD